MIQLVLSADILAEFADASSDPDVRRLFNRKGVSPNQYDALLRRIEALAVTVEPVGEAPECRDEDDRMFLHAAMSADTNYLVTYDDDLLQIGSIGSAVILRPADALARLRTDGVEL